SSTRIPSRGRRDSVMEPESTIVPDLGLPWLRAGCRKAAPGGIVRRICMASVEPGGLKGLVDVERGIISREIFVSEEIYRQELERSQWGLIEVARMENYKGAIWAAWDPSAPTFLEYLGGYKLYLDLLLDAWDGREGGTEAIGGIHKWLIPCNWKFPAENFSGD